MNPDNPALEDNSPRIGNFAFYHRKASSMKQSDTKDMFKKSSKSVCASVVVACLLLHQLLLLLRKLQKTQKKTLMSLNQPIKEMSKLNTPLISFAVQV